MSDRICIVVLHYGSRTVTDECLRSLDSLDVTPVTIFLVDNSLRKETAPFVCKKHRLEIICCETNSGFAGGCNMAITKGLAAGFESILLLNNDTTVDSNLVKELQSVLDEHPDAGIVAPKVVRRDGEATRIENAGGRISLWSGRCYQRGHGEEDRGQYDAIEQTGFCSGTVMLVRAEMLRTVGLFDEKLFMYHEDTDLCLRAMKAGFRLYYAGRTRVCHETSSALGGYMNRTSFFYCSRNAFYLVHKHGSGMQKAFFFAYMSCIYPLALIGYAAVSRRLELVGVYAKAFGSYRKGKMSGPVSL